MIILYSTIIIDTVDNLIEYAEKAVCQEFGVRDLSEIEDGGNFHIGFTSAPANDL